MAVQTQRPLTLVFEGPVHPGGTVWVRVHTLFSFGDYVCLRSAAFEGGLDAQFVAAFARDDAPGRFARVQLRLGPVDPGQYEVIAELNHGVTVPLLLSVEEPRISATAAVRRLSALPASYTMELGIANVGTAPLTSWSAVVTLPKGAAMTATEDSAISNEDEPHIYQVRPQRSGTLVCGQRQVLTVCVYGTDKAPVAVRFAATAFGGMRSIVPLVLAAVVDDDVSRPATEQAWAGSTVIDQGPPVNGRADSADGERRLRSVPDKGNADPDRFSDLHRQIAALNDRVSALEGRCVSW